MAETAILIDGGFYRKAGVRPGLILRDDAVQSANNLMSYCNKHLADESEINKRNLYRIFYYDCPPIETPVFFPLTNQTIELKNSHTYKWSNEFYTCLRKKRKVALRMGVLSGTVAFTIRLDVQRALCSGEKTINDLKSSDFELSAEQKGVDMRIGLDIASLAYKKQVNQIILIAGDSDFVPAVKHARREGIDVILDSLGQHITDQLAEHVDGMKSHYKDWK